MKLKKIVTIGYEGADFDDFLATLEQLNVTTLLDIRELPISRRPGFAKTALREGLASVGIAYRHEARLGSPKAIRHQLRDDGDYKNFFKDFERYLGKQTDLIETLIGELDGTVALLCYERDFNTCHRRSVAEAFGKRTGITPKHQGVHTHAQRQAAARPRARVGQSLSTA
jgi:uncharacterized protein (DUF488 family)